MYDVGSNDQTMNKAASFENMLNLTVCNDDVCLFVYNTMRVGESF
jgi:hypothetical protein